MYAIQYRSAFGRNYAPDLYRLAAEAAGTWFPAPAGRYDQIISRLETDLRHRYVAGYRPDPLSAKVRHDIRIEVSHPNLTVRARKSFLRMHVEHPYCASVKFTSISVSTSVGFPFSSVG